MVEEQQEVAQELPMENVGSKLRRAREAKGLDLEQVAAETRIPQRHLEVIERSAFNELPARTYAIGFTRTYARMVGLDDVALASEVRAEMAEYEESRPERGASFEPGDPAKVPSAGLAWAGGIAAIILFAGAVAFYSSYFGIGKGPDPLQPDAPPPQQMSGMTDVSAPDAATATASATTARPGDGQVVFTALEEGVWVRFYDANGNRLLEKQMASGERFEIPSDAQSPQIWTGRPDAFAITIDGHPVPKLADDDFVMRDVAISAEALMARSDQTGDPNSTPSVN
ncbi:helix-turn-helix domain-containing protein [Altererythrobacter sp.]|uniref:helix-turn-helix domain-containing protein n=1 Tax=Altererythrobacter sp. TaxID=1872480 RepID=UPI003D01C43A